MKHSTKGSMGPQLKVEKAKKKYLGSWEDSVNGIITSPFIPKCLKSI